MIITHSSQADQQKIEQLFKDTEKDLDKRLPHSVHMDLIATNPKHQHRKDLDYLNPKCEEIIKDCEVKFLQDHIERKKNYMVSEDQTHSVFQGSYSKKVLIEALKPIIKEKDPSLMLLMYFEDQVTENPTRQEFFVQKGLEKDEAYACALALSFYTGYAGYGQMPDPTKNTKKSNKITSAMKTISKALKGAPTYTSDRINRGASQFARNVNMDISKGSSSKEAKNYIPIMHYMMKALAYIPYHWGGCIRYVELTNDEQERYQTGSIVSWTQFTSSTKTTTGVGVSYFSKRNTVLHIFSLSGRYIQPFSNFPKEEEVLFAPWCNFLITKKEQIEDKTHIYLRQVELGTSKNTILWVDDRIMDEKWENKSLMESLTTHGLEKNLRIIPKISTNLALSFADSPFGQFIVKHLPENFQIITDMSRPEEENGSEAGAILIKELRQRGFNHKFTVYTSSQSKAQNALAKHAENLLGDSSNYAVITNQKLFLDFVRLQKIAGSQDQSGFFSGIKTTVKGFFGKES